MSKNNQSMKRAGRLFLEADIDATDRDYQPRYLEIKFYSQLLLDRLNNFYFGKKSFETTLI